MLALSRPLYKAFRPAHHVNCLLLVIVACLAILAHGMSDGEIATLK